MKKFEVLEHKADLKIRVFGKTKEELFGNAVLAMMESMKPVKEENEEQNKKEIKIKSLDLPALLVDFLSEVLYLTQVNKEVYDKIKFKKLSLPQPSAGEGRAELVAEVSGKKVKRFNQDIKAVTYHDLEIQEKENGSWQATILFDI